VLARFARGSDLVADEDRAENRELGGAASDPRILAAFFTSSSATPTARRGGLRGGARPPPRPSPPD